MFEHGLPTSRRPLTDESQEDTGDARKILSCLRLCRKMNHTGGDEIVKSRAF